MSVKRWTMEARKSAERGEVVVKTDNSGEWVRWEDYEALMAARDALLAEVVESHINVDTGLDCLCKWCSPVVLDAKAAV